MQQPRQQQPVPPGYQQPVPGAAPAQPPRRRRTGLVILVVALVVVLVAGGGTAAWWFVLRNRGATYEPSVAVPADEWADGARQMGSSTIAKDATIAASPDGSFLAALSENESSGTGRTPGRKRTLTGYSLADGRASESWRIDTNNGDADINFWDSDTIIVKNELIDVATGGRRDAPWDSETEVTVINGLALSCKDGSCTAWKKDGSTAWDVRADSNAHISALTDVIVRGGKRYVLTGTTVINTDNGTSLILDVPDATHASVVAAQDGWVVVTYDRDRQDRHLYTFKPDGRRISDTALENDPDDDRHPFFPQETMLSVDELTALMTGEDKDGPKDKRVGEYTTNTEKCTTSVTMDNGPSFESPETYAYLAYRSDKECYTPLVGSSRRSRIIWFRNLGINGQTWTVRAIADAKTGKSIDFPGLDPTEGDFLVFANPSTAIGYSPGDGTLTTYRPAG